MTVCTLTIDGMDVAGAEGQSVLDVAAENGITIPTLCHLDGLSDVGACRLCLVEVGGSPRPRPACVTPVAEGMTVVTTSPRLDGYRRTIIEMLFVERNGKLQRVPVTVTLATATQAAVAPAQGYTLQAGDTVVVSSSGPSKSSGYARTSGTRSPMSGSPMGGAMRGIH